MLFVLNTHIYLISRVILFFVNLLNQKTVYMLYDF